MLAAQEELRLINAAVAGESTALDELLFAYRPRLMAYLDRHLPAELTRLVEPQDVLQDTCFEAARRIATFSIQGDDCLYRWLVTIARHQILQMLRTRRTMRRGQGLTRGDSVISLLGEIATHNHTPSRSAAAHELRSHLEAYILELPQDHATAIRLRHIENLPFSDVALKMGRSEGSVQMLCNRGLKSLREKMQSLTRFI